MAARARAERKALEIGAGALDYTRLLRPGDRIVCGQMAGEPRTLTERLAEQAGELDNVTAFIGVQQTDTFSASGGGGLRFASFGAMEQTARLARDGALEIVPLSLGGVGAGLADGSIACDVVLVQLAPGRNGEPPSFSATNDYLGIAMRRARIAIAEINEQAPWTFGDDAPALDAFDFVVRSARPLPETARGAPGEAERAIAAHCARFIEDGSCIQVGIGGIPDALLEALADRRDLGFHSGLIGDGAARLIESGAITNARKPIDRGVSVGAMVSGSAALYRFVDRNAAVRVCGSPYTHALATIAAIDRFTAINSVLEVDLFGAVNSEAVAGRWIGGAGGLPDFATGARAAPRGRSIIALPATTADGRRSRIVARLDGPTTLARSLADVVVTQYGAAELRGQSLRERARRLIAIAAPEMRDALAAELHRLGREL